MPANSNNLHRRPLKKLCFVTALVLSGAKEQDAFCPELRSNDRGSLVFLKGGCHGPAGASQRQLAQFLPERRAPRRSGETPNRTARNPFREITSSRRQCKSPSGRCDQALSIPYFNLFSLQFPYIKLTQDFLSCTFAGCSQYKHPIDEYLPAEIFNPGPGLVRCKKSG